MVTLRKITWTAGFCKLSSCVLITWCKLVVCLSFLVVENVNRLWTAAVAPTGREHIDFVWCSCFDWACFRLWIWNIKCSANFGLSFQEAWAVSPCHLDLDVGHICSYGYLGVCVCDERGWEEASVCSSLHKKRNFIKKNKLKKKVWWSMDTHASPGKSPAEQWEKQREEKKYIYYSILCRIFIGLLCHWSHALCWPRPALSTMWSLYIVLYWWPVVDLIVFSCQVHFSQ